MTRPERKTVEALGSTRTLSGTASASSIFRRRCDQVMSQKALAPSPVVHHFVFHGHDLEIPTTLWERDSRTGHELRLDRLDPDGCVVRTRSKSIRRETGHISARRVAGTAFPAETRGGFLLLCKVCLLDRGLLMGAVQNPPPVLPSCCMAACHGGSPRRQRFR